MHPEGALPPPEVVRAFGASGATPVPLAGGLQQSAWRLGEIVLKPLQDPNPGEAEWVADVLDALIERSFRTIRPLRAETGDWVYEQWTAWRWLDGQHVRTGWHDVTRAADAFHAELTAAVRGLGHNPKPAWLDAREHRWARAERTVWHGAPMPPTVNTGALEWSLWDRARSAGPPLREIDRAECQVVHGDVAGNALIDDAGTIALIDMSPGWRPASSSRVQTLVEAVAWFEADPSVLDGVDRAEAARACAFRLLCGLQSVDDWTARFPAEVQNWLRVLAALGA